MLEQFLKDGVGVKVDVRFDMANALFLGAVIFFAAAGALAFYARIK